MGKVIGIDLGTTNSVVAHEDHTGAQVVLNRANERTTPSVVGLPKPKAGDTRKLDVAIGSPDLLIGSQAVDGAARNAENTIFSIKRLMGRFYDDPNVPEVQRRSKYRVVKPPDADDVRVMLGDRMLTPTEISAMILRRLKEDAESRLGDEVTHAVITVPAYFSMSQRLATRTAGEMAGLRVKAIIDEPSAAAMAFGVNMEPGAMKTVLVYDLGGGTFDISILFITGEMFDQLGIQGDMWLGGDDFDYAIVQYVLQEIQKEFHTDPSADGRFMLLLKKAAEKAKIQLSELLSASIVLESAVALPNSGRGDVDVDLTRRTFEDLPITEGQIVFAKGEVTPEELRRWCEDLKINGAYTDQGVTFGPDTVRNRVKKSILLTRKAMKEAGVTREQIDHVLLVGGATAMPMVQKMLEDEFGPARIMRNIDPMACVGMGAGLAATRIPGIVCQNVVGKDANGRERVCLEPNGLEATACRKCGAPLVAQQLCPDCHYANALDAARCANPAGCAHEFRRMAVGNLLAKPVGIKIAGDTYEVIVPKNTPYPMHDPVVQPFRTSQNSQKAVRVPIYHAEVGEFNAHDVTQWIGAADINLAGALLPAGTRVDVCVRIDSDGCMDVEARIQDGSGRRQQVFINPNIVMHPASDNGGSDDDTGSDDGEPATPKWQNDLKWSILWAEIALKDYEWLFTDHRTTQTLQRLIAEANVALERKDEAEGRRVEKAIDGTLEADLKGALILLHGEMRCLNPYIEPGTRTQIRSLINGIIGDIRSRASVEEVNRKVGQLNQLLVATRGAGPTPGQRDRGTELEKIGAPLDLARS